MEKIAVLIPCYNESQSIGNVVKDFKKAIPEADIYVFDNNSTDNTDKIAQELGAIVKYEYRQGKGNVVRSMFRKIEADCYIMVDGDNTYPAENAREMCNLICNHKADMVIGDRLSSTYFTENKRPFHNFGNELVRKFINFLWHPKSKILDVMTGYRAFSYEFVKSFPVISKGFEIETEMTIHALDNNFTIQSIPIQYRDREEGSVSKLNTFSDGYKVIKTIIRLYIEYKPLLFFSFIFALLLFLSLVLFIPILSDFLATGLVPKFPTLIVSGLIAISSLLSLLCGVILDQIIKKDKKSYELFLNIIELNKRKRQ